MFPVTTVIGLRWRWGTWPVSLLVTCPCGQQYETPATNAGLRTRCPECGRELSVPKRAPSPELEVDPWTPVTSVLSGKAIGSLAFGLLLCFACLSGVPAILLGREALREIDQSKGRLKGRGMAITGIVLGVIGCLFTISLVLPAIRSTREAARRAQCTNNLKQIGLAFHNYYESYGTLPPAAMTDRNGRPLLSWRVAIYPFVEASPLYSKFHLDEPWDSPHNLSLLEPTPLCYVCPSDGDRKPGMTSYQVVIGPTTAFTPDFKPLSFAAFTDGTSHTILVGESRHDVPWTKPDDLPFDMAVPLSGLGSHHGYHDNGFNVLFADGSVRFLKRSIPPSRLRMLLTPSGSEGGPSESY